VHGDDRVQARPRPAANHQFLVIEGLEVGLGQRCDDLYTLTVDRRVEEPVEPRATLPAERCGLVFDVCVRGVRPFGGIGWPVVELGAPVVPVVDVPAPGDVTVPAPGVVTVPPGPAVVDVPVVEVPVVVGTVVVVVPVVVGVVVVPVGVVVVVVPVVAGPLSAGVLSGSISSEIGRGCRAGPPVPGAAVLEPPRTSAVAITFDGLCGVADAGVCAGAPGVVDSPAGDAADTPVICAAGAADAVRTGAVLTTWRCWAC
jgi:hypothetical protein